MANMRMDDLLLLTATICLYLMTADAVTCPQGAKLSSGKCVWCPKGTFSRGGISTTCTACTLGRTTLGPKSKFLADCKYCPAGYGQTSTTPGSGCTPCAVDQYAAQQLVASATCTDCPDGRKTPKTGSTSVQDCTLCAVNRAGRGCAVCPAGSWSAGGVPSPGLKCKPCPTGRTASGEKPNAVTETQACDLAKPGYGWKLPGATAVQLCPKGQWSPGGSAGGTGPIPATTVTCTPCAPGSTTSRAGATAVTECNVALPGFGGTPPFIRCPAGTYSAGGLVGTQSAQCTPCPEGSTTGKAGATDASACSTCKPGYAGAECDLCETGKYSPGGLARDMDACFECPEGFTTPEQDGNSPKIFASDAACTECEPGYGRTTDPNSGQCEECPFGTYSPGGANAVCTRCDAGYTTPQEGSQSVDQCTDCAMGYGSVVTAKGSPPAGWTRDCALCPKGWYGVGGPKEQPGDYSCRLCARSTPDGSGTTTIGVGATSQWDCTESCIRLNGECGTGTGSTDDQCCPDPNRPTYTVACLPVSAGVNKCQ